MPVNRTGDRAKQAGRPGAGGNKGWINQTAAPAGVPTPPRKATLLAVTFTLLALSVTAFFVWLYLLQTDKPVFLALFGAGYEENLALPHNAYGFKGLKDLVAAAPEGVRAAEPTTLNAKTVWKNQWEKAQQDCKEETLVVFVALHGTVDDDGKPCLLFDDPAARTKVTLDELLDSLGDVDKKVLLILEPALAEAHWPAGILHNEFVSRLKDRAADIEKRRNLLVICASDAGQPSWVSEEWRQTVFTHYLIAGLNGAAGTRISAWDLFSYLHKQVTEWSVHNRGIEQSPVLLGGEERARAFELLAATGSTEAPDDRPGNGFEPSKDLQQLWEQTAKLRKLVPFPATYSPQLWRYYLDWTVRFEQLERAGYPKDRLRVLKDRLTATAKDIRDQARLDKAAGCLGWTLPMPAVLGIALPIHDEKNVDAALKKLYEEPADQKRKALLAGLVKQAGDEAASKKLLRGQLHRALLKSLGDKSGPDPLSENANIRNLLRLLQEDLYDGQDRPAEAHLLVMLLQDLDPKNPPSKETIREGFRVRLLAEEAALAAPAGQDRHPYSEVVSTWVRPEIELADKNRRLGEDWLFAAAADEKALKALSDAATHYHSALANTEVVRKALDLRDRALADLPYYAWWVAQQRTSRNDLAQVRTDELANELKRLAKQLEDRGNLAGLKTVTKAVDAAYQALQKQLRKECDNLKAQQDLHDRWHDTEALLALPILLEADSMIDPAENRGQLLISSRRTSEKWNAMRQADARPALPDPVKSRAILHSRQQLMAYASLRPFVEVPADLTSSAFRAALEQADQSIDSVLKDGLSLDPAQARTKLEAADMLCRGLPMTTAAPHPFTAPQRLRRLRMHDLLVWQADRTGYDHWWAETQSVLNDTYYLPAARAYLEAAGKLSEDGIDEGKLREELASQANFHKRGFAHAGLKVLAGPPMLWTSQNDFPLTWKLGTDDNKYLKPFGVLVASLGQIKGAKIATGSRPAELRTALDTLDAPVKFTLTRPVGERPERVTGQFTVLYRGQHLTVPVNVESREADLIVRRSRPAKEPAFAVQMDKDFSHGAICIVLDCSGSMLAKYNGKSRFQWACDALESALGKIPAGTPLSMFAFIEPRVANEPNVKYRMPRGSRPWSKAQLRDLMAEVRILETEIVEGGRSPIADALLDAKTRGFPDGYKLPKILIGLTDGDDNLTAYLHRKEIGKELPNFETNPAEYYTETTKRVQKFLQDNLNDGQYETHVICFNTDKSGAEAERARKQFTIVKDFIRPGSFLLEANEAKLADALDRAIRPKLNLVDAQGKRTLIPVNYSHEKALRWKRMPSGDYTPGLPVPRNNYVVRAGPGDLMLIKVMRDGSLRDGFRRGLLSDLLSDQAFSGSARPAVQASGGKVVSVPLHQWITDKGRLEQVIAVEDSESQVGADLNVVGPRPPRFLWLETKPVDGKPPSLVRWFPVYDYPAPAYRVEVEGWPYNQNGEPVAAQTRVWWSESIPALAVEENVRFKQNEPFLMQKVRVGGSEVTIEDIAPDQIASATGEPARECLVLRLSCPDLTKRFRVEILPNADVEEEHRYFTAVGRLTSIFWTNVKSNYSFRIIAVDALKQENRFVMFPLENVINESFKLKAQVDD